MSVENIGTMEAILSLVPSAQVMVCDDGVTWIEPQEPPVSEEEISLEVARLKAVYVQNAYKRNRASEYPPITDYLDGVVKGDQAQIDAYIAACQAVKAKYPKPESV
jgi:hypothetical protein